jgi:hypothetical protein
MNFAGKFSYCRKEAVIRHVRYNKLNGPTHTPILFLLNFGFGALKLNSRTPGISMQAFC